MDFEIIANILIQLANRHNLEYSQVKQAISRNLNIFIN